MLINQTNRKPEETLEFKMNRSRETFNFRPPIHVRGDWMLGVTDLEVYNSICNITEETNKFELYRDTSDKFGFLELKDELEKIFDISYITVDHLDDEVLGPRIIDEFIKLSTEKKNNDGYIILLLVYARSLFRDFQSYLRILVDFLKKIFN